MNRSKKYCYNDRNLEVFERKKSEKKKVKILVSVSENKPRIFKDGMKIGR